MKASTCSFNPGVFVANLTEWKRQNITNQLEKWMKLNVEYVYNWPTCETLVFQPWGS